MYKSIIWKHIRSHMRHGMRPTYSAKWVTMLAARTSEILKCWLTEDRCILRSFLLRPNRAERVDLYSSGSLKTHVSPYFPPDRVNQRCRRPPHLPPKIWQMSLLSSSFVPTRPLWFNITWSPTLQIILDHPFCNILAALLPSFVFS